MVDKVQENVFLSFFYKRLVFYPNGINVKKKMKYITNGEISNPNQVIMKLPNKCYLKVI